MAVQPFFWPQFQFFLGRNSGQLGQFHDLRWKHPRFWEFWGDYICGIFKSIFNGILIIYIYTYICILLLLLLLMGSLMVSLMGYLILVLIHVCTIGFLQRNATGMMVWYHQQYDISGMIEISTISHGRPMDVQHGPKMLVILATNFSISVTEKV